MKFLLYCVVLFGYIILTKIYVLMIDCYKLKILFEKLLNKINKNEKNCLTTKTNHYIKY